MARWTDNEPGPDCPCGAPRIVKTNPDGTNAILLCITHTSQAGAAWPLPPTKPPHWPHINPDKHL